MFLLVSRFRRILLFAIITLVAYGLLLPWTGFYWDDWPFAWIAEFLGPAEFVSAFLPFRPFLGPIFFVTTSLIPPIPVYWQIFALVIRFIIGLTAWWSFKQIFPNQHRLVLTLALFMLVFPGYSQHWVALTHINQELIPFIFYLLSFGFTFKALRVQNPVPFIAIAVLLQICGIFPTEYFFALEGLRFMFLFFHFRGNMVLRFGKAFRAWAPYFLVWILNAVWLFYYYAFGSYDSYGVVVSQLPPGYLFGQVLDALWKAGVYIWVQVLVLSFSSLPSPVSLFTLGLIAISFMFLARYLFRFEQTDEHVERPVFVSLTILGIAGILLGRLPSLVADLPIKLQTGYDRLMISMMIGGSLFAAGLIEALIKNQRTKLLVIAILVAFGIGQQFFNANIFRRDWEKQAEIYWQMVWRMPGLEPGTVLLTNELPVEYETDLSFTAPINWMYAPDYTRSDLPFMLLYTEKRLGGPTLPNLEPGTEISYLYRTVHFRSSTSNVVVIYMPANGCLRVLDSSRVDMQTYAGLPARLPDAIPSSDLSRIILQPASPARPVYFPEPAHQWCYYHAKAELAQQQGDCQKVVSLGNEAISLGFHPQDENEWLVFIEAYALTGDLQTARRLSVDALASGAKIQRGVCAVWRYIREADRMGLETQIREVIQSLNCDR
ncbi:MAG: hypothetical protein C4583_07005 [Anaerolineaceae bacterium]|nr:MAG: hypothetical protein C4583_07005 [Anaerolineaceae bacterium]